MRTKPRCRIPRVSLSSLECSDSDGEIPEYFHKFPTDFTAASIEELI